MNRISNPLQDTGNKEWLGFWSSYAGNIIGLIGLAIVTQYQNNNQKKYLNTQLNEDNKRLKLDIIRTVIHENRDLIRNEVGAFRHNILIFIQETEEYSSDTIKLNLDINDYLNSLTYIHTLAKQLNTFYPYDKFENINNLKNEIIDKFLNIMIYNVGEENIASLNTEVDYSMMIDDHKIERIDGILKQRISFVFDETYSVLEELSEINDKVNMMNNLIDKQVKYQMECLSKDINDL
ncbi:hypothetical protein ETI05_03510 [Macrococcoides canis]|nr:MULTISPECIES: hypothetical protein [Macrococcus]TDM21822.1 hypothetical protein ETI05_03510 [Macrococcus canis]